MKTTPQNLYAITVAVLFSLVLTSPPVFGQTDFTTDPVGLIDLTVSGGSAASPKLSLVSPTLTKPILWQGVITGISGTTITVGGTPWTASQFNAAAGSHYVEIISTTTPARSGTLADITATTTSTITTFTATGAAIGDSIKIRKDVTISDLFGATNSAGLLASDDPTTADEVLIYIGATATSYFYYTGAPGYPAGWYNSGSFDPAGSISIAPNEAVVIKRKTSGNLSITFAGAVKTGNTLLPIQNGLNVLGTASAKGMTLFNSGLNTGSSTTGVFASDDPTTADEILLYSNGSATSYFYYNGGAPGYPNGWYESGGFTDANNIPIAPGTAFVLKRKNGIPFNWALPSPTSF